MNRTGNPHSRKIFDHFSGNVFADYEGCPDLGDQIRNMIIVHFTNRSGSNYFCDLLGKAVSRPSLYESLNWDAVVNQSKRRSIHRFSDYVSLYLCKQPSIVKASTDQLFMLTKWGYLRPASAMGSMPGPWILSVQRSDVISQAVSFAIATQTGKYASFQENKVLPSEVIFDADLISRLIAGFGREYQDFLTLTSALGYQPYKVYYEDLLIDPQPVIADLCRRLCIPCSPDGITSKFHKQADEINERHRRQYIRDLDLF